ncbi:probable G-protein coupled receptor 141 [Cyprinus carpio]|uniref:G protein-coupled receptor 141 n=2 Tax=Cyprinus carpio TaxID=7962 RepID=A0A9J7YH94_CYPCA|nr:probable G-protein coupled receptor 141 [Cyprinus carpio]
MANPHGLPKDFKTALLVLYTFIFLFGTLNVILMSCMLQFRRHLSFTKVSVINLIAVHSIFLLTVPFRIYYYASDINWTIGSDLCKLVSLMVHGHMYLAFIFYVSLLIVRYVEHSSQRHKLEFHRILHATVASATVWLVMFCSVFPTVFNYGDKHTDSTPCFHFSKALDDHRVKILNYVLCTLVILVWSVLAFFQVYFLIDVSKTFGKATCQRQEFWAQVKNVVFLSVMFFSFVPYQGFRVYYVSVYDNTTGIPNTTAIPNTTGIPNAKEIRNTDEIHHINEVFLAVTAFSCFDMIVFAGRDVCKLINSRGWFNCL